MRVRPLSIPLALPLTLGVSAALLASCAAGGGRSAGAAVDGLPLSKVELYRNGVGYFERKGDVDGDVLKLKVRKDQVNDLLKSLTVIDRSSGKVLSVSLPLDPAAWQNVAQASFTQGGLGIGEMLSALRGTVVRVQYRDMASPHLQETMGRIAVVRLDGMTPQLGLLDEGTLHMVQTFDQIVALELLDNDVALHLSRDLDAGMGEGMFQQVEVAVRLTGEHSHDLQVSYVVEAPQWKPSYRLVLDSKDSSQALLQAWAVVDNVSGENWNDVQLNLTSGAPIAFRYDLHSPRNVARPDLSRNKTDRQAAVAIESASNTARLAAAPPAPMAKKSQMAGMGRAKAAMAEEMVLGEAEVEGYLDSPQAVYVLEADSDMQMATPDYAQDLAASMQVNTGVVRVAGLSQFQLLDPVSLPNGSASMVAIVNQKVPGRGLFLYKTGGSGKGYEHNPYRVVRFQNATPFALEPGPLSVMQDGHFVGEGITDIVGTQAVSTIPFAVEPSITVESESGYRNGEHKLLRIVKGMLYTETFDRLETTWKVRGSQEGRAYTVLVQQAKRGGYKLASKHEGIEENPESYMVPVTVAAGADSASVLVVEETPRTATFSLLDNAESPRLLSTYFSTGKVSPKVLAVLKPIVDKRGAISDLMQKLQTLAEQQNQYDSRLREIRGNLEALSKDKKADDLRARLNKDLLEFTEKSNAIGRDIVDLKDTALRLRIELQDMVKELSIDSL